MVTFDLILNYNIIKCLMIDNKNDKTFHYNNYIWWSVLRIIKLKGTISVIRNIQY